MLPTPTFPHLVGENPPNILSTDSHSSSAADQVSHSKNQGENAVDKNVGATPVVRHPNTSLVANCSMRNRNED
jgi:hypothetical protein